MSTRREWVGNQVHMVVLVDSAEAGITATIRVSCHVCDASIVPKMEMYPIHIRRRHLGQH